MTTTGRMPTPAEVKKWDELSPGAGSQLLGELLCQLRHQRRMRAANMILSFYGPFLGFAIAIAFLAVAGWLIHEGHGVEGTFLGVVDIVSLASVFALGRRTPSSSKDVT
jgi:hypothetical protein